MRKLLALSCLIFMTGCSMTKVRRSQSQEPFSFGVIADIQHADMEKQGARYYREVVGKLQECVKELNQRELAFTIQLGDIINGNNTPEKTLSDLDNILEVYNTLSMPKYHVIGNHCLTAGKKSLQEKLKMSNFYYDFTVPAARGWRFIVLNGNDAGYGVLGKEQLQWLESKLKEARDNRKKVIVFNHFALSKDAARSRMKTSLSLEKMITESGCVVAYFAGHDHAGGYALQDGIHHVTVKGMVEAPIHNAYAVIEVYPAKLNEIGFGKEPSRELNITQEEK